MHLMALAPARQANLMAHQKAAVGNEASNSLLSFLTLKNEPPPFGFGRHSIPFPPGSEARLWAAAICLQLWLHQARVI